MSEAIWLYTLQYYIIIFDKFCWSLSFPWAVSIPWHSVHHCSGKHVQQLKKT